MDWVPERPLELGLLDPEDWQNELFADALARKEDVAAHELARAPFGKGMADGGWHATRTWGMGMGTGSDMARAHGQRHRHREAGYKQ